MYRVIFLLAVIILMACSTDKEQPVPVPEYMFEVFSTNQPCDTINYVKLDFGDSIFFLSDTIPEVRVFDRFDAGVIGVGLAKTLTSDDEPDVGLSFYYFEKIEKKYDFIKTGSYKFRDFYGEYERDLPRLGVYIEYGVGGSNFYFVSLPDSASFFHVNGKSGDDFQMRLCGQFDILMEDTHTDGTIRVKGEYSLLFTDYFF